LFDSSNTWYNVGIGTNTPAYRLDVNGTGRFNGNMIVNNSLLFPSAWFVNPMDQIDNSNGYGLTLRAWSAFDTLGASHIWGDVTIQWWYSDSTAPNDDPVWVPKGWDVNIVWGQATVYNGVWNSHTRFGWSIYINWWTSSTLVNDGIIYLANDAGRVVIGQTNAPYAGWLTVDGGIKMVWVTSNPCAWVNYPEGTMFYNSTNHHPCICINLNTATKMDWTTACF
jgi:hypothetical protein